MNDMTLTKRMKRKGRRRKNEAGKNWREGKDE